MADTLISHERIMADTCVVACGGQIYIHGGDVEQFGERLPRGFSLRRENASCAVLVRASSPPPIMGQGSDEEQEGGMLMFPGEQGEAEEQEDDVMSILPEDGNMTQAEYREQVRKRMVVLGGLADQGDMQACMELGARLLNGNGTRKDPVAG